MFLNGSLENFSVADILQLLSFSKQTGALHVRGETNSIIYLDDGEAYFATKEGGEPLEETVAAAGIPRTDWNAALESAGERYEAGRALAERGVAADLIGYVVHLIVSDTTLELIRMPRDGGSFDFRVGEQHPLGPVHKLRIDDLVAEVRERLAQWEAISEFISSPSDFVSASNELAQDSVELSVTREQWALLVATIRRDGSSIAELARETGRSDAEVASALHPLIGSGLMDVAAQGNGAPAETAATAAPEPLPPAESPSIAEAGDPPAPDEDVADELTNALFPPVAPEVAAQEPSQEMTWWRDDERSEEWPAEGVEQSGVASPEPPADEASPWQPLQTRDEDTQPAPEQPPDEGELQLLEPPPKGMDEWRLEPDQVEPDPDSGSQLWFEDAEGSDALGPAGWDEGEATDPFGDSSRFELEADEQLRASSDSGHPDDGLWDLGDGPTGLEAKPEEQQREMPLPPPEVESTGLRTLALQELRDLAGTAPVQPARGARPAGPQRGTEPGEEKTPITQPKVRALRRIIAAVRGL